MRTLKQIKDTLVGFEKAFGLPVIGCEQGSQAWLKTKLGVISASNAAKVVAKVDSETRHTYMCELVAQVCTGAMPDENNFKAMEWGKLNEAAALSSYMLETNFEVMQVPFIFKDETFRVGCSPDGITPTHGLELKCPYNTANYIKFLCDDELKSEWMKQVQFCMWVTDAEKWDVSQYDKRMRTKPLHTITVERDAKQIKIFDEMVPQFILDMDAMLVKAGASWGEQWAR